MSSLLQLFNDQTKSFPHHSRQPPTYVHSHPYNGHSSTPKVYPRIEAHDSSSIHAGDAYTTYYGDYHNHISTSKSIILFGREVLDAPPENILGLVEGLRSTTMQLEQLQHEIRALEGRSGQVSQEKSSPRHMHRVQKARRASSKYSKVPQEATSTIHTSIRYIPPPAPVASLNRVVFTMKVRFTITYHPTSAAGVSNRWYKWEVDVVNPSYRRLLASSPHGFGIINIAKGNRFLPYCELYITLEEGWSWDDDDDDDDPDGEDVTGELSCHSTKLEVVDCLAGRRTIVQVGPMRF